jgi:hypothetical protein
VVVFKVIAYAFFLLWELYWFGPFVHFTAWHIVYMGIFCILLVYFVSFLERNTVCTFFFSLFLVGSSLWLVNARVSEWIDALFFFYFDGYLFLLLEREVQKTWTTGEILGTYIYDTLREIFLCTTELVAGDIKETISSLHISKCFCCIAWGSVGQWRLACVCGGYETYVIRTSRDSSKMPLIPVFM